MSLAPTREPQASRAASTADAVAAHDAPVRPPPGWPAAIGRAWAEARRHGQDLGGPALVRQVAQLRAELRPAHLQRAEGARALALVALAARAALGWRAHDEQGLAAWWMLQGRLVEMATGEGKTLATALAAATAALAGLSVHVLTANDYLVVRDRAQMAPLFDLLGLASASLVATDAPDVRRAAYRCPIVYTTARELVFDHLKDHLGSRAERDPRVLRAREMSADTDGGQPAAAPLLPQLQQVFIDEADSILLDEALIPFVLSMPGAAPDPAPLSLAWDWAAAVPDDAVQFDAARRSAGLTAAARAGLHAAVTPGSPWWPPRQASELVRAALVAQRLLRRDHDYAVVDGRVLLIDEVTGRIAQGRQWGHPLQAMVELKEGCALSAPLHTAARITYQRFFPRYERLGGMSGSLREAGDELQTLYHCAVVEVPRARPSQMRWLGRRLFRDAAARQAACVEQVCRLADLGRPVLVGTASVEASVALAGALAEAGLQTQVLHALQDAEEARLVARAGEAGCVTVATNMAGRGTDIRLTDAARMAGGLHVILALCNRSRRIDRQLAGRAARQGDPGSAEALLSLDDAALVEAWPAPLRRAWALLADGDGELPAPLATALARGAQARCEARERALRRQLQRLDDQRADPLSYAGPAE